MGFQLHLAENRKERPAPILVPPYGLGGGGKPPGCLSPRGRVRYGTPAVKPDQSNSAQSAMEHRCPMREHETFLLALEHS